MKPSNLTWKGCILGLCIFGSLLGFVPVAFGQEIEPNNTCPTAQEVGTIGLPFTLEGSLDSTPETSDVDFFRFTGTPASTVMVDLEGQATGQGTLGDPFLGLFDSNCNLMALDDDGSGTLNSRLVFTVPADGIFVLATTQCCDSDFIGGGIGTYRLSVTPLEPPVNDDVANAIVIPALDFTDTRDTRGATTAPDDPGGCSGGTNVWYTFTPSENMFVQLSTAGSSYEAFLDVFVSVNGGFSHITCASGQLAFQASAGITYYFMISSSSFGGDLAFAVQELLVLGSISGQVVDALTGAPLPGDIFPSAAVELQRCEVSGCFAVNFQSADSTGHFQFSVDFNGQPLEVGIYRVVAFANEYQTGQTEPFEVGEGEDHDVGDVPLQPFPIQFSEIRPCGDLPPEGGACRYSVRIHNRHTGPFQGATWSVVESGDIGSFTGFTRFQPQRPRDLKVDPEESRVVHFSFEVPSTVRNGAFICVQVFVGQGVSPFFDTVGHRDLFCLLKGFTGGFSVMSAEEVKELRLQADENSLMPSKKQGLQEHAPKKVR